MESNKIPSERHPKGSGFGPCGSGRASTAPVSSLQGGYHTALPGHSPPWLLRVLLLRVGFQRGIDLLPQRFHLRGAGQTLGICSREKRQVGKGSLQRGSLHGVHGQERTLALFNRVSRDWDKSCPTGNVPAHCRRLE